MAQAPTDRLKMIPVFFFRYYENALNSILSSFESSMFAEKLRKSLLEPASVLGYQTPMDVILQEDIDCVRQHSFFHAAFMDNQSKHTVSSQRITPAKLTD